MSLVRLVYNSALIGGWAAFLGWLLSEILVFRSGSGDGILQVGLVGGLVGAAIGIGLSLVAGMANGQWKTLLPRILPGLLGGGIGGAAGALIGDALFRALHFPRALGWLIVGLGIGVVEGLYERSASKIRNGLIGGAVGGLLGGMFFDPIQRLIASTSGMPSRAVAFVVLGLCIGAFIGLAQVVLKDAWLTVLDGWRAGRQLILSQPVTILGRADHLSLPFLGAMNHDLELEHVKITRQPKGGFVVEDQHSRLGTRLNSQPLTGQVALKDGDIIKFGMNFVRFNQRQRRPAAQAEATPPTPFKPIAAAPPPPQVRKPALPSPSTSRPSATPYPGIRAPGPSKIPELPPGKTTAPKPPPGGIAPPPPPRRPKG